MKCYSYQYEEAVQTLPQRKDQSHKGSYGKLLLIAGSKNMAGASFLAAKAAYRSGVGLVYLYVPESNRIILQQMIPEAVLITYPDGKPDAAQVKELLSGKQAIAMGPGIGMDPIWQECIREVLNTSLPVVLDADALNVSAAFGLFEEVRNCDLVITPHPLEMSRLCKIETAQILSRMEETAVSYALEKKLTVVLKEHHTVVTQGSEVYRNQTGNHGMATGGSGDVLTGILGSLLAQKMRVFDAAKAAVYFHGKAGDDAAQVYGRRSLMAGDIAEYVFRGL